MGSGSVRVKCETFVSLLWVRRGVFSWEYPVFTPPNHLALFEMREIILKGRKSKSYIRRNKGVHTVKLVLHNKRLVQLLFFFN